MIAVLADDFTGAAELAGISLRFGLKVILGNAEVPTASTDVLIVSSDSRSLSAADAMQRTQEMLEKIVLQQPSWIYKKTDAVLRGYVMKELMLQMNLVGAKKVLFAPANPSLNRTIRNQEYYIGEALLHQTAFANDPEFPARSSNINQLLSNAQVQVLQHTDSLPQQGVVVAVASSIEDTKAWAAQHDGSWMLAGAGDFYTALLQQQFAQKELNHANIQLPHLYVCGTAFAATHVWLQQTNACNYLPAIITEVWLQQMAEQLQQHKKAIIAIAPNTTETALALRTKMALVVQKIIEKIPVKEIFIEGGSTATAVLQALNMHTLEPLHEWERGVVRMQANDCFITVKPGSYQLPQHIKDLYQPATIL